MYNYDKIQLTENSRYKSNVRACKVVGIDRDRGLEYQLPFDDQTSWIKPRDFEVNPYKVGDFIDMILCTISSGNYISLRSAQFIGRTPDGFVPANKD